MIYQISQHTEHIKSQITDYNHMRLYEIIWDDMRWYEIRRDDMIPHDGAHGLTRSNLPALWRVKGNTCVSLSMNSLRASSHEGNRPSAVVFLLPLFFPCFSPVFFFFFFFFFFTKYWDCLCMICLVPLWLAMGPVRFGSVRFGSVRFGSVSWPSNQTKPFIHNKNRTKLFNFEAI